MGKRHQFVKTKILTLIGLCVIGYGLYDDTKCVDKHLLMVSLFCDIVCFQLKKRMFFITLLSWDYLVHYFISTNGLGIPGFNRFETVKKRIEPFLLFPKK
jgi:hypothetical protein